MMLSFHYVGSNAVILKWAEMRCTYQISRSDLIARLWSHGPSCTVCHPLLSPGHLKRSESTGQRKFFISAAHVEDSGDRLGADLTRMKSAGQIRQEPKMTVRSLIQMVVWGDQYLLQVAAKNKCPPEPNVQQIKSCHSPQRSSESSHYWASLQGDLERPMETALVYNNDEWLWAITMKTIYGSLHRHGVRGGWVPPCLASPRCANHMLGLK